MKRSAPNQRMANLWSINADIMGACMEGQDVYVYATPQEAYAGPNTPLEFKFFWMECFITDPIQRQRVRNGVYCIDQFFADLVKLHYVETGQPQRIPHRLTNALKERMLLAMYPDVKEVALQAKTVPATIAVKQMLHHGVFGG